MPGQPLPIPVGDHAARRYRSLRVVPSESGVPSLTPSATGHPAGTKRRRAATTDTPSGKHAQRSASAAASLAEMQIGISVLQLADQALAEVVVLVRRLREVAVRAAAQDTKDREGLQDQAFGLVEQIGMIGREVRFDGTSVFDGSLAGREISMPGGGRVCVDVAPMNGRTIGVEVPWGRAPKAAGAKDAELVASTGTLPAGTFSVIGTEVFDAGGSRVAAYLDKVVDFGAGVTATFDSSVYDLEGSVSTSAGSFTLDCVISVRTASAAAHAIGVVDAAAAVVTEQRLLLGWSRSQLAQAAAEVIAANRQQGPEVLDAALAADGAKGLAEVILGVPVVAVDAHRLATAHGAAALID